MAVPGQAALGQAVGRRRASPGSARAEAAEDDVERDMRPRRRLAYSVCRSWALGAVLYRAGVRRSAGVGGAARRAMGASPALVDDRPGGGVPLSAVQLLRRRIEVDLEQHRALRHIARAA